MDDLEQRVHAALKVDGWESADLIKLVANFARQEINAALEQVAQIIDDVASGGTIFPTEGVASTIRSLKEDTPYKEYEEHHFQKVEDVGVAWDGRRVWVCLNGVTLFRAKIINGALFTEFYPDAAEFVKAVGIEE